MKIKIGDQTFDPDDDLVAIYLTDEDKQLIANMAPDARVFCAYPNGMKPDDVMVELVRFRAEEEDNYIPKILRDDDDK
jgi:hypothetical protein